MELDKLAQAYELAEQWCVKKQKNTEPLTSDEVYLIHTLVVQTKDYISHPSNTKPYFKCNKSDWDQLIKEFKSALKRIPEPLPTTVVNEILPISDDIQTNAINASKPSEKESTATMPAIASSHNDANEHAPEVDQDAKSPTEYSQQDEYDQLTEQVNKTSSSETPTNNAFVQNSLIPDELTNLIEDDLLNIQTSIELDSNSENSANLSLESKIQTTITPVNTAMSNR